VVKIEDFSTNTGSSNNLYASDSANQPLVCTDEVPYDISECQSTSVPIPKNYVCCTICQTVLHKSSLARHLRTLHTTNRFIKKGTLKTHAHVVHSSQQPFARDKDAHTVPNIRLQAASVNHGKYTPSRTCRRLRVRLWFLVFRWVVCLPIIHTSSLCLEMNILL